MKKKFPLRKSLRRSWLIVAALISMLALHSPPALAAAVELSYIYNLSDFNGAIPSSWVRFAADREAKELYVVNPSDQSVSVIHHPGELLYSIRRSAAHNSKHQ